MEARELRIGNFCYGNGVAGQIDASDLLAMVQCEAAGTPVDFIKPIPLTEEWLEKFGFEMLPKWYSKAKDGSTAFLDLGWLNISRNVLGGITLCDPNGISTGLGLDYVHQLQNLYFALKGQELTIK